MDDWGLGFLLKIKSQDNLREFVDNLNTSLESHLTIRGGAYQDNWVEIHQDEMKPDTQDEHSYDVYVSLQDSNLINDDRYKEQVEIARKFVSIMNQLGYNYTITFAFNMPDNSDPSLLL